LATAAAAAAQQSVRYIWIIISCRFESSIIARSSWWLRKHRFMPTVSSDVIRQGVAGHYNTALTCCVLLLCRQCVLPPQVLVIRPAHPAACVLLKLT
jgi:hypothetical protein